MGLKRLNVHLAGRRRLFKKSVGVPATRGRKDKARYGSQRPQRHSDKVMFAVAMGKAYHRLHIIERISLGRDLGNISTGRQRLFKNGF